MRAPLIGEAEPGNVARPDDVVLTPSSRSPAMDAFLLASTAESVPAERIFASLALLMLGGLLG